MVRLNEGNTRGEGAFNSEKKEIRQIKCNVKRIVKEKEENRRSERKT